MSLVGHRTIDPIILIMIAGKSSVTSGQVLYLKEGKYICKYLKNVKKHKQKWLAIVARGSHILVTLPHTLATESVACLKLKLLRKL